MHRDVLGLRRKIRFNPHGSHSRHPSSLCPLLCVAGKELEAISVHFRRLRRSSPFKKYLPVTLPEPAKANRSRMACLFQALFRGLGAKSHIKSSITLGGSFRAVPYLVSKQAFLCRNTRPYAL